MNENKLVFQDFLRSRIHSYRSVHAFSQEHMAEALRISPRSYIDQEHGKYGFYVHWGIEISDGKEERRCCRKPYLIPQKYISC